MKKRATWEWPIRPIRCALRVQPGFGLLDREHVLPDRVPRRAVEERRLLALRRRAPALAGSRASRSGDVRAGPLDGHRGGLGEGGDVERRRAPRGRGCRPGRRRSARGPAPRRRRAGRRSRPRRRGTRPPRPRPSRSPSRTASSAGRLAWMSLITADAQVGQRTLAASSRSIRCGGDERHRLDRRAARRRGPGRAAPCATASRPSRSRRSIGRRSRSWATTAPTRRCCWRRRWAKALARRRPARGAAGRELGAAGSVDRIEVAGPGFVNLFLSDAWYRARDARAWPRPASDSGPAPDRHARSGSWSSSSPPTRPGRCTSAAAATPPTATRSCACWRPSATRSSASTTSTTPAARSSASPPRSPPACAARSRPEDGYGGEYVIELGERIARRGDRRRRPRGRRAARGRAGAGGGAATLERFGVSFDTWFSERDLYRRGEVEAALADLDERGHTYRSDDALWLRTTDLRRRQGPGPDPRQRRADLPRRRRRLPLGQAAARLRAPDRRARRRSPRLRGPGPGGDRRRSAPTPDPSRR